VFLCLALFTIQLTGSPSSPSSRCIPITWPAYTLSDCGSVAWAGCMRVMIYPTDRRVESNNSCWCWEKRNFGRRRLFAATKSTDYEKTFRRQTQYLAIDVHIPWLAGLRLKLNVNNVRWPDESSCMQILYATTNGQSRAIYCRSYCWSAYTTLITCYHGNHAWRNILKSRVFNMRGRRYLRRRTLISESSAIFISQVRSNVYVTDVETTAWIPFNVRSIAVPRRLLINRKSRVNCSI